MEYHNPSGGWASWGNPPGVKRSLVLKVGKRQFHLSIHEFLLWHHGVNDVLNLRAGVTCFLCARVRCHDLHVKPESPRQIASSILCVVRRRILPTRVRKLTVVCHVRCSLQL